MILIYYSFFLYLVHNCVFGFSNNRKWVVEFKAVFTCKQYYPTSQAFTTIEFPKINYRGLGHYDHSATMGMMGGARMCLLFVLAGGELHLWFCLWLVSFLF